ncbi:hypothetical protein [Alkaliphilus metalliredigens]|nr:hypothetical protein [Alkaliphilus metalliredigens]
MMANILLVAGPNSKYKFPGVEPAGFWHGVIAPITFIVSLFNPNVRIYEINNKGVLHDFGFILGASGSIGGGGTRVSK